MTQPLGTLIEAARTLALRPEQDLLRMLAARTLRPSVIENARACYQEAADRMRDVLTTIEERKNG